MDTKAPPTISAERSSATAWNGDKPSPAPCAIDRALIRLLFDEAPRTLLGAGLAPLLALPFLWPQVTGRMLAAWLAVLGAILAGRLWLLLRYRRMQPDDAGLRRWRDAFGAGALLTGLAWGFMGAYVAWTGASADSALFLCLLVGTAVMSISMTAPVLRAYLAYALPALLPPTVALFVRGGEVPVAMGAVLATATLLLPALACSYRAATRRSLAAVLEKESFITELKTANARAERANAELAAQILDRQLAEASAAHERQRAHAAAELVQEGLIAVDENGIVQDLNALAEHITGWSGAEACGLRLDEVLCLLDRHSRQPRPLAQALGRAAARLDLGCSLVASRTPPLEFTAEVSVIPVSGPRQETTGAVVLLRETMPEVRDSTTAHPASRDPLTGLFQRQPFAARLQQALDDARDRGAEHALCYIGLDNFKTINGICGHPAGDRCLKEVAELLKGKTREADILARLGGDEFGLLLESCPIDKAYGIAEGLVKTVRAFRFECQNNVFTLGVSVGVIPIDAASSTLTELLRDADAAYRVAKGQGGNRAHLSNENDGDALRHTKMMQCTQRVQRALREQRFGLVLQPIVPLDDAAPGRYGEILLRLVGDLGELVPPAEFLPAAERYHLMPEIDTWVIGKVLALLEAGEDEFEGYERVTVNISGQSLGDRRFVDDTLGRMATTSAPLNRLCFEITETSLISDWDQSMRFISALRERGCHFALDDFGTGFSSMTYLKSLPVDLLKIDGSFVREIAYDRFDYSMVRALNDLAHLRGIKTVAEHVENDSIRTVLSEIGVDFIQGYGIAEPYPVYGIARPNKSGTDTGKILKFGQ